MSVPWKVYDTYKYFYPCVLILQFWFHIFEKFCYTEKPLIVMGDITTFFCLMSLKSILDLPNYLNKNLNFYVFLYMFIHVYWGFNLYLMVWLRNFNFYKVWEDTKTAISVLISNSVNFLYLRPYKTVMDLYTSQFYVSMNTEWPMLSGR